MDETPVVDTEDGHYILPYTPGDFLDATAEILPPHGMDYILYGLLVHTPPRFDVITMV